MVNQIYYLFVASDKQPRFDGEPALGERGFHAAERPLDALYSASSDAEWLYIVRLGSFIAHNDDKVAAEGTVITILNARGLLVEFALWNAEQAFEAVRKLGIEPDKRSIEAVRVARLWLEGKANKEELFTAAAAARVAADVAATTATSTSTRAAYAAAAATRAAARATTGVTSVAAATATYAAADAAVDTADAATYAAAYATAYAADVAATRTAARAVVGANGVAASDTARDAARAAQNGQLEQMIADALCTNRDLA